MGKRIDKRLLIGACAVFITFLIFLSGRIYLTQKSKVGWEMISMERPVRYLGKDGQGLVWAAGVYDKYLESAEGDLIQAPVDAADGGIDGFLFDQQGNLWAITGSDTLLIRDTHLEWRKYHLQENIRYTVGLPIIDHQTRAWGKYYLNDFCYFSYVELDEEKMQYSYNTSSAIKVGSTCENLQSAIGGDGNVWVINDKQLYVIGVDGQWIRKTDRISSFGGEFVFDVEGNLWIGSSDTDLYSLDQDMSLSTYPGVKRDAAEEYPVDVYGVDSVGRVWGEKWEKGLFMFTAEEGWKYYNSINSGIPYDNYYSFLIDNDYRVWVATNKGLVKFDPAQVEDNFYPDTNAFLRDAVLPGIFLIIVLITVNITAFLLADVIKSKTILEFGLGFLGWLIFISIFWGSTNFMENQLGEAAMALILCFFIPLPITIISLIVLLIKRRWIAMGMFSALLLNAVLTLMLSPTAVPFSYPGLALLTLRPFFLL